MRTTLSIVIVGLFFVSCSSHIEKAAIKETEPASIKTQTLQKNDVNTTAVTQLTPLQKCKTEENKFNLIVNVPFGSIVRIMNIKPVYEDCIALEKGKYHIEVVNDSFEKYDKWINLDSNTALDVKLQEIKIVDRTKEEKDELEKAGYNRKLLKRFIKKYPMSDRALVAKNRIGIIKKKFRSYSPKDLIKSNNCIGFYPKNLVEKMLNISTPIEYWSSIRWSGECKNNLMYARGVIYFKADNGLSVELKGKMKNGFFEGRVYNYSKSKDKRSYIKDSGRGYYIVKLKNRFDFIHYQE